MDIQLKNKLLFCDFLRHLPASFYWKNKDGIYLDGNNYLKNKMQASGIKIDSLIGKSDYTVFSKEIAHEIRNNDVEAMINKEGIIKKEKIAVSNDKRLIFSSSKKPSINK